MANDNHRLRPSALAQRAIAILVQIRLLATEGATAALDRSSPSSERPAPRLVADPDRDELVALMEENAQRYDQGLTEAEGLLDDYKHGRKQNERPVHVCPAPDCGNRFNPGRKDQVYCSEACSQRAKRERRDAA